MRRLLNTIYITTEQMYLSLEEEQLVCLLDGKKVQKIPFDNIEGIICMGYRGCSPALMGECVSKKIPISFVSPQGKFLAKVCGETKGNVFLRVQQIDCFRENAVLLAQNAMAAKFANSSRLLKKYMHDHAELRTNAEILQTLEVLSNGVERVYRAERVEELLGIEGNCAKQYFSVFHLLLTNPNNPFTFTYRSKRPPLDPINAVLSFVYTIYTTEFAASLEVVGLDSYIGYYHALHSGRVSLACDLVEEARCFVDQFVLTLFNRQELKESDFQKQVSGAVWLNKEGRQKVLTAWQTKKRETEMIHPFLKQKIAFGLLPYVQSNLLAKYIRGDLEEYPCFLWKKR